MNKKMIAKATAFLMLMASLYGYDFAAAGSAMNTSKSVTTSAEKITYSGGTASFTAIRVNLKDPKIQLEISTAGNAIGKVDSLPMLVSGVNDDDGVGVAGINGTFFNAYTDLQPAGTILQNGHMKQIANTGSAFGVGANNQVRIDAPYFSISGGTEDQWEWPYNWYAWNINHFYADKAATMIFDPNYKGVKPVHDFTVVSVSNGKVIKIDKGSFNIPANGFLIMSNDKTLLAKFKAGTKVDYKIDVFKNTYTGKNNTEPLSAWNSIMTGVGAGPTLVKSGKIVVDPKKEGFTEEKILNNRGQRSFVGVTKDQQLIMASVGGVTMKQLAEIALKMTCTDAINFDGGASSGIYANGKSIVSTGRLVSNALVVKQLKSAPAYYKLNDQYFFLDHSPYWDAKTSQVYVPIKALDQYFNGYGTLPGTLKLKDLSFTRNKVTYVSLTDAAQLLNIEASWDSAAKTVKWVKADYAKQIAEGKALIASGKYVEGAALLEQVIVKEPANIVVLKELAKVYHTKLAEYNKAVPIYEQILKQEPNNGTIQSSYAWVLYTLTQYDQAILAFTRLIELEPQSATGYYVLGSMYASWSMKKYDLAKNYYNQALAHSPTNEQKQVIEAFMKQHP